MFAKCALLIISIHALRVEGDIGGLPPCQRQLRFLSTPSGWRATKYGIDFKVRRDISIHALRVEGDSSVLHSPTKLLRISIHALRVEGDSKNGQSFRLFLCKREKNLPL